MDRVPESGLLPLRNSQHYADAQVVVSQVVGLAQGSHADSMPHRDHCQCLARRHDVFARCLAVGCYPGSRKRLRVEMIADSGQHRVRKFASLAG